MAMAMSMSKIMLPVRMLWITPNCVAIPPTSSSGFDIANVHT